MKQEDHYRTMLFTNSVFDIIGGCAANQFIVDVKGLRPKRYRVLYGDQGELIGRDATELRMERPHIAIAIKTTLQSLNSNGDKGLTNEHLTA
jgi:hypothetical protein